MFQLFGDVLFVWNVKPRSNVFVGWDCMVDVANAPRCVRVVGAARQRYNVRTKHQIVLLAQCFHQCIDPRHCRGIDQCFTRYTVVSTVTELTSLKEWDGVGWRCRIVLGQHAVAHGLKGGKNEAHEDGREEDPQSTLPISNGDQFVFPY